MKSKLFTSALALSLFVGVSGIAFANATTAPVVDQSKSVTFNPPDDGDC